MARSRSTTKYDFKSPAANFFYKAFLAFLTIDDDDLVGCINGVADLVKNKLDPRPKKDADKEDKKQVSDNKKWFSTVIKVATTIISFVCEWKDALFSFITSIFKDEKRYRRRNRLFFQGKAKRMKICFILCWAKKAYEKFMNTSVGKGIKKAFKSVKEAFTKGMDKILDFVTSSIATLMSFYNTYIKKYADTLARCASAGMSIAKAITKITKTVAIYTTGLGGVAELLKNIICSAEDIVEMIKSIYNGFSESDSAKKWGLFGKAFGIIVKIATGARRRI